MPVWMRVRVRRFLCRDEEELQWLLDMQLRVWRPAVASIAILLLALAASAPQLGWAPVFLVAAGSAAILIGLRLTERSRRVEPMLASWCLTQLSAAAVVVVVDQPSTSVWTLLLVPMVGAGVCLPGRVATLCAAFTAVLITFTQPLAGSNDLTTPLVPVAVLAAIALLSGSLRRSSIDHRAAAIIDPLTGMLNRSALAGRACELEHQSARTGDPIGLITLDIDHFKVINDGHGHDVGDQVLKDVAYRIRKELRAYDLAYRLGGEEFLVLAPGATLTETLHVAERLRTAIAGSPVAGVPTTVSIGVAVTPPRTTFDYAQMFAAADAALYRAKREGRNRVCTAGADDRGDPADRHPETSSPTPGAAAVAATS